AAARKAGDAPGPLEANGAPTAPVAEATLQTLHTLQARLQAQLDAGDVQDDPAARTIRANVRGRLHQVDRALARIAEGQYGTCADCRQPIEQDRLVLQPFVTRCTPCQNIAEWRGLTY
ncbi:MAG TPA: TraR/DksA C4-type zinc finger protein, partial [Chloroflexia bacterium]|nr:TraR/DksA C4-type zinc finger protein [Chloroflexia bacterium]